MPGQAMVVLTNHLVILPVDMAEWASIVDSVVNCFAKLQQLARPRDANEGGGIGDPGDYKPSRWYG